MSLVSKWMQHTNEFSKQMDAVEPSLCGGIIDFRMSTYAVCQRESDLRLLRSHRSKL
jgi:hypothetical protein